MNLYICNKLQKHFKGFCSTPEVIMLFVYMKCRFSLSYRDLEEIAYIRGAVIDHSTLQRRIKRFTPLFQAFSYPEIFNCVSKNIDMMKYFLYSKPRWEGDIYYSGVMNSLKVFPDLLKQIKDIEDRLKMALVCYKFCENETMKSQVKNPFVEIIRDACDLNDEYLITFCRFFYYSSYTEDATASTAIIIIKENKEGEIASDINDFPVIDPFKLDQESIKNFSKIEELIFILEKLKDEFKTNAAYAGLVKEIEKYISNLGAIVKCCVWKRLGSIFFLI